MNKKLLTIISVLAGIFLLTGGAAYASDDANPGDLLYPVDLAVESVQRLVITDAVTEAEFESDILAERVDELEALADDGELEDVDSATDYISEQEDVLSERARAMEETCDAGNCDEGEKTRVTNRIETQTQEHVQSMEQTNTKLQDKFGEEDCAGTCGKIEDAIVKVGGSSGGNGNN